MLFCSVDTELHRHKGDAFIPGLILLLFLMSAVQEVVYYFVESSQRKHRWEKHFS